LEISDAHSHADLYAKALQIYLKYPSPEQWLSHWNERQRLAVVFANLGIELR
jgi:hypothetical protein